MIDLYTWSTPNGYKVSIMLEECGLEYNVHPINIREGEQFSEAFINVCPNSKIPAIVDNDTGGEPVSIFESGAILLYLAEKTGKFLPESVQGRAKATEWVMWQMANVGPMFGQANHFINTAEEKIPYAMERYTSESARLLRVMDDRLKDSDFLAGDNYSIADIASYPWISLGFPMLRDLKRDVIGEGVNVERWINSIVDRPAVQKGIIVPNTD